MGGGDRECPPTRVGAPFVPLPPPVRCRHTDAEAYKECFDAYLEGLIAGGTDLCLRLLEHKARDHDSDNHHDDRTPSFASEAGVDMLSAAGNPCQNGVHAVCGWAGRRVKGAARTLRGWRTSGMRRAMERLRELLARAALAEGRLVVALGRFQLPNSVFAAAAGGARNDVRHGVRDDCGNVRRPAVVP